MDNISETQYFEAVIKRLKQHGFSIIENVTFKDHNFKYIAKRTTLDKERYGLFSIFFVFSHLVVTDFDSLKEFSKTTFRYVRKTRGIYPPPGFFYGFTCFPVAIVDKIDSRTIKLVHLTDPPKHYAKSERLIVFDLENKQLIYSVTNPRWGSLYHHIDREMAENLLSPRYEITLDA